MLTALTSHLGLKASYLVPTQQQWPRLSALINQLHHHNMVLKNNKKRFRIQELQRTKKVFEFPFLYFKKDKELSQVLGHLND